MEKQFVTKNRRDEHREGGASGGDPGCNSQGARPPTNSASAAAQANAAGIGKPSASTPEMKLSKFPDASIVTFCHPCAKARARPDNRKTNNAMSFAKSPSFRSNS